MTDTSEKPNYLPIAVEVEEGRVYPWCSCGKSKTQPFCDRQDCGDKCIEFKAELTETLHFCACKLTKDPPLCDGSHAKLLMEMVKKRQQKS